MNKHCCEYIYYCSSKPVYGQQRGVCVVTGKESTGIKFDDWVRNTFTDYALLKKGDIVSNEALFCFDEQSEEIAKKVGKDKPQRFRNYSHFVFENNWVALGKDKKEEMLDLLLSKSLDVCIIAESGQRHLFLRAVPGLWLFEDRLIQPDVFLFHEILKVVGKLADVLSVEEIRTGVYQSDKIKKVDKEYIDVFFDLLQQASEHRGSAMFDLAVFFAKTYQRAHEQ